MKTISSTILLLIIFSTTFSQQRRGAGLIFDDDAYEKAPIVDNSNNELQTRRVASSHSLKKYSPTPQDQGSYNNCVGWSTAYVARTIIEAQNKGWETQEEINQNAFAPGFIYKLISDDNNCYQPTSIDEALKVMVNQGAAKFKDLDAVCPSGIPKTIYAKASLHRIKNYQRLFFLKDNGSLKVESVKRSLLSGNPVVIGMRCPPSFEFADGQEIWKPKEKPNTTDYFGHAMCVIGYDDQKYGGAFEIQNSWGTSWGNKGYIWVRYKDFANFAKYAYILQGYRPVLPIAIKSFSHYRPDKNTLPLETDSLSTSNSLKNLYDLSAQALLVKKTGEEMTAQLVDDGYKLDEAYQKGAEFKLFINNKRSSYVYVIQAEKNRKAKPIFPLNQLESRNKILSNQIITIPEGDHFIQLDDNPKNGYLCILLSKTPLDITEIVEKIDSEKGDFKKKINKALSDMIVNSEDISFFNSEIAFSAFSRGKNAVALIIETSYQ